MVCLGQHVVCQPVDGVTGQVWGRQLAMEAGEMLLGGVSGTTCRMPTPALRMHASTICNVPAPSRTQPDSHAVNFNAFQHVSIAPLSPMRAVFRKLRNWQELLHVSRTACQGLYRNGLPRLHFLSEQICPEHVSETMCLKSVDQRRCAKYVGHAGRGHTHPSACV